VKIYGCSSTRDTQFPPLKKEGQGGFGHGKFALSNPPKSPFAKGELEAPSFSKGGWGRINLKMEIVHG
jgi:hypothetical protein